jgi:hypothetical protein
MRLIRLGDRGAERPAVIGDDGQVFDLGATTDDIDGPFLAADGIDRVRDALAAGLLARLDDPGDGSGLRVGAPLARPTAVVCIGQNYAAHAAESGSAVPEQPVVFLKHPNTVVGPYDDVVIPVARRRPTGRWSSASSSVAGCPTPTARPTRWPPSPGT